MGKCMREAIQRARSTCLFKADFFLEASLPPLLFDVSISLGRVLIVPLLFSSVPWPSQRIGSSFERCVTISLVRMASFQGGSYR